jgi:hypothetical protein
MATTQKKKKKKKHFSGKGPREVHTARTGSCRNPDPSTGTCNYQKNAASAEKGKAGNPTARFEPWAAHHILPVSSLVAYQVLPEFKGDIQKLNDAYRATPYCAHRQTNMLWMPLKRTYRLKKNHTPRPDVWDLDRPCHDWDHLCKRGYLQEVVNELCDVWRSILDEHGDDKECTAEAIFLAYEQLEQFFLAALEERGRRPTGRGKGTEASLRAQAALQAQGKGPAEGHWWLPFSMADDLIAQGRPPPGWFKA